jgi:fructokinase
MMSSDPFDVLGRPSVVGTGLLALDVVLNGGDEAPRLFAGGTCGNVLMILSWLGWDAFPVARLGPDDAGRRAVADLRRFGVQLDVARLTPRAATPIIIERLRTSSDGQSKHQFSLSCPVCGSWLPRFQPVTADAAKRAFSRLPSTSVFFFDRASRGALLLAKAYADKGALVMFEPSGNSDDSQLKEALSLAHICKYSAERFQSFRWPMKHAPWFEIQTLGEAGFRYRTSLAGSHDYEWRTDSAFPIGQIRDAAGAGDWFSAGLIHRLGQGALAGFQATSEGKLKTALHFARVLAAWNCQFEGARGGMYALAAADFRQQVLNLLSGQDLATHSHIRLRANRLSQFHCPIPACRERAHKLQ